MSYNTDFTVGVEYRLYQPGLLMPLSTTLPIILIMTEFSYLKGAADTSGVEESISKRFDQAVQHQAHDLAVISCHQPASLYGLPSIPAKTKDYQANPYLRWSYRTLALGAARLVASLVERKVRPQTPFMVICDNRVEYAICMLAAFRLGLVFVPLSPDILAQTQDARHILNTAVNHLQAVEAVVLARNTEACHEAARLIPDCNVLSITLEKTGSADECVWIGDLLSNASTTLGPPPEAEHVILHTSGSTSTPKCCLIRANGWVERMRPVMGMPFLDLNDRIAITGPGHHMFGFICTVLPLAQGATIVIPTPRFQPDRLVQAIRAESCTIVPLVPSMAHSVLSVLNENGDQAPASVRTVVTAGMPLNVGLLSRLQECFRTARMDNTYGMTEGLTMTTALLPDSTSLVCDDYVAVGQPVQGLQMKICDAETRQVVPRGTWGDLHFSGPTLSNGYLSQSAPDAFYEEDGQRWVNTGDVGFITEQDAAYVVGRSKDLIIRGGENVSPAKLEGFLAGHPSFQCLQGQVVAGPDAVAGEVPVLVTNADVAPETVQLLREETYKHLGPLYVPADILSLQALGMTKFPLGLSGKVQKKALAEAVKRHLDQREPVKPIESDFTSNLAMTTRLIWAKVLRIQPDLLPVDAPLAQLADSMLMISAREHIRKQTGQSVSISDWLSAGTIADQIRMLDSSSPVANVPQISHETRQAPPSPLDIVHVAGDEVAFGAVKQAVEQVIQKDGFCWDEVQDVIPRGDFMHLVCRTGVVDSANIRAAIVANRASVKEMREALEKALQRHPLLLSYIISDTTQAEEVGLYAVMRPGAKVYDRCIIDYGDIETLDQLKQLATEDPGKVALHHDGLSFRALVVFVKETGSAAIVTNIAHGVADATSGYLFLGDLDAALSGRTPHPHVPYKLWAETYHALRHSPKANAAVRYQVEQLRDLGQHLHALWPPPSEEVVVSPERAAHDGHTLIFLAPSFIDLQKAHPELTPHIVMKAALATVCLANTNHTHALFGDLQADRARFPFLPESYRGLHALETPDVAGPTVNNTLNLVDLRDGETAVQFLARMLAYQQALSKHPNVPWQRVFKELGLSQLELDPISAATDSILFNWQPNLASRVHADNPFQAMRLAVVHMRPRLGLLANVGAGGVDGNEVIMNLQGAIANTSTVQITRIAEQWKRAALWLADQECRARPVTELVKLLQEMN
ncbi:hypothetical protein BDV18DRAFT_162584 [Aspergillus unguis]